MANNKLFTKNLAANSVYVFANDASATGGVLVNDTSSTGSIEMLGTAQVLVNGVLEKSSAIVLAAGEFISFSSVTPLEFTITTQVATTGKLLLAV